MSLSKETQGELFIAVEVILWSLFPIVSILILSQITPILSLGISTLVAGLFFLAIQTKRKKLHELIKNHVYKDILIGTLILGILFYGIFYLGLQYTTANNAAIIAMTQQFFSILYFGILTNHEKHNAKSISGALLIFLGACIIIIKKDFNLNLGDILILIGTAIAPFGNYFMQRARKSVSSNTILTIRSLISGLFLIGLSLLIESPVTKSINSQLVILFLINGIFLLGLSKTLWLEGIHRISISKALIIGSTGPAITMLFSYFILQEIPTLKQILGLIPVILGLILVTERKNLKPRQLPNDY